MTVCANEMILCIYTAAKNNDKNILILQCGGAFPPSTATAPALSVDILMTVAPAVLKNANMI